MRCSVVFDVTLRLLVINISSSSAINTAAYYQRCVITCETVAVVHRRPCLEHLGVAALTQAVKPDKAKNRDFCLPHLHSTPTLGGSRRHIAMPIGTKKQLEGVATRRKIFDYMFIRFDTTHERDRQRDTQTDIQTPHDGISRTYA